MKKLLVLVLALMLICSAAFAEVNLTVTSWRTDDKALWDEINAKFHEENPDITVEFLPVTATEYDGVLQTKLASENAEDIMFLRAFGSGRQIYDAGYVLPLTEEEIKKYDLELAGVVPQDELVYEYDTEGKPSSQVPDDSPIKKALKDIIARLDFE